jgi:hypothetical protein
MDLIVKMHEERGQAFIAEAKIPGTPENILVNELQSVTMEGFRGNYQLEDLIKRTEVGDRDRITNRYIQDGKVVLGNRKKNITGSGVMSGASAALALHGTTRRFVLYNSGIMVDMIRPTNQALGIFVTSARVNAKEFGRVLGGFYYRYQDFFVRKAALDCIRQFIVNATVSGWSSRDNILNLIKLPDLDVLFWAAASLMYPNKFDKFRFTCENITKRCDNTSMQPLDLSNMFITDFPYLVKQHPDLIPSLISQYQTPTDANGLARYHDNLGFTSGKSYTEEDKNILKINKPDGTGYVLIYLEVPSVQKYLDSGERLFAAMVTKLQQLDETSPAVASTLFLYRQYASWVRRVEVYNSENTLIGEASAPHDIEEFVDTLQSFDPDVEFINGIDAYTSRSKLSVIGHAILPCPKCGHTSSSISGYFTVDPLHHFFILSTMMLTG